MTARFEIAPRAGAGLEFSNIINGKVLFIAGGTTRAHGIRSSMTNDIQWREGPPGVAWEDGPATEWAAIHSSDDFS